MKIAVDFDGTIVTSQGEPVPGALSWLARFSASLILFTCRSGTRLDEAVKYLKDNGIELAGVNRDPDQDAWSSSPKTFADLYIDDKAFGCPLLKLADQEEVANWAVIGPAVMLLTTPGKVASYTRDGQLLCMIKGQEYELKFPGEA